MRGINRQVIFENDEDNKRLIDTLKKYKTVSGYKLYAYCLMGNHFHLLIKTEKEDLDVITKRIAGSYVYWYNTKYKRCGHLFQDRYRSEAVENDRYFLSVLLYIHQNPVKAGLCKDISKYKYSSYMDYINEKHDFVDVDFLFTLIDKDTFIDFSRKSVTDIHLDANDNSFRINDADAGEIIQQVSKCKNATEFQSLEVPLRDRFIKELKQKGLSIRQINRLTGISFGIVRKL